MPLATSVIKTPAQPNWQLIRRHYFADLMHLDHQLGRVMETLEQ